MPRPAESRARFDGQSGAALIEYAAVMLLLCVTMIAIADFGRAFYTAMALTNAVRAGAQYGAQSISKTTDTSGMTTAALNSGSADLGASGLWVRSASRRCECDGTIMGNCPPTGTCTGTTRIYVTVTASKLFTLVTGFPGLPNSVSIERAAQMRAK